MSNRILFCTGEGIGNVVQCIPVVRTLINMGYTVDFWHAFGSFPVPKIIPYVDRWYMGQGIRNINIHDYKGKVSTLWTKEYHKAIPLPLLNTIQPLSMTRSEIDTYMDIARDLGANEEDLIWYGHCNYIQRSEEYDVVINNGYNRVGSANWSIKSYPYYTMVADALRKRGLSVCSVGARNEHIQGTENRTGLNLLDSLGILRNCGVFLGNDSGLYHCANALEVDNIVIFTATSIEKNYDSRFHKFSTIMGRDDLECRPCQAGRRWARDCKDWHCQKLEPEFVFAAVLEVLNEG
jgi:ADP-heptose:LPS heptosyltransferase